MKVCPLSSDPLENGCCRNPACEGSYNPEAMQKYADWLWKEKKMKLEGWIADEKPKEKIRVKD